MEEEAEAIAFVSQKCPHSQEIIKIINGSSDLRAKINIVDIQSLKQIPSFVDRVPLLFTHDEKIYHDEELFNFVRERKNKTESFIEPFMSNEMKGMSDYYSFMGDDEDKKLDHVYSFVDKGEDLITQVKSDATDTERIVNYDSYIEKRAEEIQDVLKQQSPAVSSWEYYGICFFSPLIQWKR